MKILIGLLVIIVLISGCVQQKPILEEMPEGILMSKEEPLSEELPEIPSTQPITQPPIETPTTTQLPETPIIPTRESTEEKITGKYYPTYLPEAWELLVEREAKDKMSLPVDNQYHDVTLTVLMYGKNAKKGELPSPYMVPENADALISIHVTAFEEEGLVDRMKTERWEEAFAGKTETKTNYDKELWCVSKPIQSVKLEGCIIFCDSKTVIEAMCYRKLGPGPSLQKECIDIIKSIECA